MNLEKSDTLDRHDTQEAMPNFQTNDTPHPVIARATDGCGSWFWRWWVWASIISARMEARRRLRVIPPNRPAACPGEVLG